MSKLYFMEILFQNDLYFTGTWTYQVRLPIPSMQLLRPVFRYKADNCNICIKIVIMFFCIEFQKPSSCGPDVRNGCCQTIASHMMSTILQVKTSASYDAKSTRRLYYNVCFDSTVLLNTMF